MTTTTKPKTAEEQQQLRDFRRSLGRARSKDRDVGVWGLNNPEDYVKIYGKPEPLSNVNKDGGSPLSRIFMDGSAKHNSPLVERNPIMILPGMTSFDEDVLRFQVELCDELNKALPAKVDSDGFTPNGVHTGFDRILGVAGYMQNPMSAKTVDNTLLRETLGLRPGYNAREMEIAKLVWDIVWREAVPSKVKVPKKSAGGMRRMSHDVQWKLDYARWKTAPVRYEKFLNAVESGDVYYLANEMEIVYGTYIQKRLHLDDISKVRWANDWTYAKTGGREGGRSETDKKVVIDGVDYPRHSALRVRVIDAGPWTVNCDLQMVASSHMKSLFARFPKTFHINTSDEIKEIVDGKYVFCSDVSEYDQSMCKDAISVIFTTMRKYYREGVCASAERLYAAPYFARPLDMDGNQGLWMANPMNWKRKLNSGNRSGHAFTSLAAKVNKVIETLFIADRLYRVTPRNIEAFLKGDMPIAMINNGDDEVVYTQVASDLEHFKALRADLNMGSYVVTPELGQGFSGLLLVRPDPTKCEYFPSAKLQTPFEKCYVPERSIGTALREFWPIGWFDRKDSLYQTDAGREAWDIHNSVYARRLEGRYGSLNGILERALQDLPILSNDLTPIEREVLADPDKLHHKYDDSDVREFVLNAVTSNIPEDYTAGWLKVNYSGHIK